MGGAFLSILYRLVGMTMSSGLRSVNRVDKKFGSKILVFPEQPLWAPRLHADPSQ